ncbi:MAG TPA: hypothetical protein VLG49_07325 [Rhabdochlamydiaceae bacterium]|nr:hypothetical protein [Rhabdochlamydiaceae bacterium]
MSAVIDTKAINDEFRIIETEILTLQISNPPLLSDIVLSLEKLENLQMKIDQMVQEDPSKFMCFPVTLKKAKDLRIEFLDFYDDQSREIWTQINLWKENRGEVDIRSLETRVGRIESIESANPNLPKRLERLTRMQNALNAIQRKTIPESPIAMHKPEMEFPHWETSNWEHKEKKLQAEEVNPILKSWQSSSKRHAKRWDSEPNAAQAPQPSLKKSLLSKFSNFFRKKTSEPSMSVQEKPERSYAHVRKKPNTRPFRKSIIRDPNYPLDAKRWI